MLTAIGGSLRSAYQSTRAANAEVSATLRPTGGGMKGVLIPGNAKANQLNASFAPTGGSLNV